MEQHTCACICICGCVHICIHMHVCCPDGGGSSGGMVGVKHLCGSKPRSGQLQRPMFKVNGGLRWLFISRLLHPRWTPSANRHQPSSSSLPFSLSVHRDRSWTRLSTGIHFILCVTPPSTFSHIRTLTQWCLCISRHNAHGSTHHPCTLFPRRAWALSWPLNLCVSREQHPDHPCPSLCVPMAKVVTPHHWPPTHTKHLSNTQNLWTHTQAHGLQGSLCIMASESSLLVKRYHWGKINKQMFWILNASFTQRH